MAVRRGLRPALAAAAVGIAAAGGALAVPPGAGAAVPAVAPSVGTCSWLTGVAALSATNVWAVGSSCSSTNVERALILHWNGSTWSVVKSPSVGLYGNRLSQVVAVSPTDIWAVGTYEPTRSWYPVRSFFLHWNGAGWRVVPSPSVGTADTATILSDITAVSRTNLWAVGTWRTRGGNGGAVTMRWNGTAWKLVPVPASTKYEPASIDAVSADDIWATGTRYSMVGTIATFSMHWNGRAWGVIPMPNVGVRKNNFLFGQVHAVARDDVWVTGSVNLGGGDEANPMVPSVFRSLVLHWSGDHWSVVPSPSRGNSDLYGGTASTSARDVWTVGGGGGGTTLIEHWNGSAWSIVSSPSPGRVSNHLLDVAAVSPTVAFAVGSRSSARGTSQTLVLRWNGRTWTVI
jgi:Holliday junction resolvase